MAEEIKKKYEHCCEVFPVLALNFGWFTMADKETEVALMPYMQLADSDARYRVNYCPSCGKYIRGVEYPTSFLLITKQ
jgi:hypothetical protein